MAGHDVMQWRVSEKDRLQFAHEIEKDIEWLAQFGADESGGVTRLLYSETWITAQQALYKRMEQSGLQPYYDDCGNLFGKLEGNRPEGKTFLTGSHLDTVVHGGKYDGAYGILAGMIALKYLREKFGRPHHSIEVVSLCEEEGSRFPLTFWGSGNISGKYDLRAVPDVQDEDGYSLQEAMEAAGFGRGRYVSPLRTDLAGFVELHIEQGIVLEREKKTIGIVDGIVGQRRFTVRVTGLANHAGTTPMHWRMDALAGACEMIAWLEQEAMSQREPFVATVGKIKVKPNVSNVIPGEAVFSLEVRAAEETEMNSFCNQFKAVFSNIAKKRNLKVSCHEWMRCQPVWMDVELNRRITDICEVHGFSCRSMFSGAGHDAQVLQSICPTTLLFVQSQAGISHSPQEYSPPQALADGIVTLAEWLYLYGYEQDCEI